VDGRIGSLGLVGLWAEFRVKKKKSKLDEQVTLKIKNEYICLDN
jgi:hypothetical protein